MRRVEKGVKEIGGSSAIDKTEGRFASQDNKKEKRRGKGLLKTGKIGDPAGDSRATKIAWCRPKKRHAWRALN